MQETVLESRAREVVDNFLPTSVDCAKVTESFTARSGRDDLFVELYDRELLMFIVFAHTKEMFSLTSLYNKFENYLRSFKTLDAITDKQASTLYFVINSCFSAEILKAWNKSYMNSISSDAKKRLDILKQFLKIEDEGE